jgi:hypothetical protein
MMQRFIIAAATGAFISVLAASSIADTKKQSDPGATSTASPQKQLCDAVLNMCVSRCYETLGTVQDASRTCTRNCTNQYHRCKKTGTL